MCNCPNVGMWGHRLQLHVEQVSQAPLRPAWCPSTARQWSRTNSISRTGRGEVKAPDSGLYSRSTPIPPPPPHPQLPLCPVLLLSGHMWLHQRLQPQPPTLGQHQLMQGQGAPASASHMHSEHSGSPPWTSESHMFTPTNPFQHPQLLEADLGPDSFLQASSSTDPGAATGPRSPVQPPERGKTQRGEGACAPWGSCPVGARPGRDPPNFRVRHWVCPHPVAFPEP